ncbi:MAG: 2-dehydro-3-deoxygalactonokinase [Sedimentitalea sp.]
MVQIAQWIAADWGTTHLRVWAMQGASVVAQDSSDQGMARLAGAGFERALLDLIADWLGPEPTDIIACGMVGARQGWVEAPYHAVPCAPLAGGLVRVRSADMRLNARIVPGLKQTKPADVMRGEETQIAGFLALNPGWDGVICLPGTHTKWVEISAGEVVSFQSFMTGELFATLSQNTVLRHSIAADGWHEPAFEQALEDALSRPERLAARLFSLRATDLLEGADPKAARARLSGMLIGAELAAAKPYWLGRDIALIGTPDSAQPYGAALKAQGAPVTETDSVRMTLSGLTAAWRSLKDTA